MSKLSGQAKIARAKRAQKEAMNRVAEAERELQEYKDSVAMVARHFGKDPVDIIRNIEAREADLNDREKRMQMRAEKLRAAAGTLDSENRNRQEELNLRSRDLDERASQLLKRERQVEARELQVQEEFKKLRETEEEIVEKHKQLLEDLESLEANKVIKTLRQRLQKRGDALAEARRGATYYKEKLAEEKSAHSNTKALVRKKEEDLEMFRRQVVYAMPDPTKGEKRSGGGLIVTPEGR